MAVTDIDSISINKKYVLASFRVQYLFVTYIISTKQAVSYPVVTLATVFQLDTQGMVLVSVHVKVWEAGVKYY